MALVLDGQLGMSNEFNGQMGVSSVITESEDKFFAFRQGTASDTWTVVHNLNKYPSVTVVDSTGRVVVGGTQYLDSNTVVLTFSGAFSGVAYLN